MYFPAASIFLYPLQTKSCVHANINSENGWTEQRNVASECRLKARKKSSILWRCASCSSSCFYRNRPESVEVKRKKKKCIWDFLTKYRTYYSCSHFKSPYKNLKMSLVPANQVSICGFSDHLMSSAFSFCHVTFEKKMWCNIKYKDGKEKSAHDGGWDGGWVPLKQNFHPGNRG